MGIYSPSTNYALTNLISNKNLRSSSRLTLRGHSPATLTLLFHHAHRQATTFIARQHLPPVAEPQLPTTTTFLHLPYHPQDPNRHTIQQLWNSIVARPTHQTPLHNIKNLHSHPSNIDRLTIAYSRPPNIGNQLSICNIQGRGMPVSSYTTN
jgi:hypothetical protein